MDYHEPTLVTPPSTAPRRRSWFSRAVTAALVLNVVALVTCLVVLAVGQRLGYWHFHGPPPPAVPATILYVSGGWLVFAWPVIALVATIYGATIGRNTPGWLLRTITALGMLAVWLSVCLWLVLR